MVFRGTGFVKTPHIGLVAIGGAGWMGGANYVRNLATAIRAADPEARISWLCGESLRNDWMDVAPRFDVRARFSIRAFLRGRMGEPLVQTIAREGVDFIYPLTYDNEYNLGLRFPVRASIGSCDWAGWIPDFQHRHLPELFTEKEIQWRDSQIAKLVDEAPRVVLSSHSAAEDFRTFHPAHAAKATVLSFAVPPIESADDASLVADAPERFFLVCNQFWKHKNHLVLFQALGRLRARGITPKVLCTGQLTQNYRDGNYTDIVRAALAEGGLEEQVQLLGLVPRARLIALLRRSVAVIQPSLFEGWSTVVEDARVLGRPCVLSDLAVHREQHPPGARFFDPCSPEALAEVLAAAWDELPAGPDFAAEEAARAAATQRLAEVGRQFLALATTNSAR